MRRSSAAFARLAPLLLVFAAVVAIAAVAALPASANNKPVTGPRVSFFNPPSTFAANTPFYVEQGFGCALTDHACVTSEITGQSTFLLYLDGILQTSTPDVDVTDGVIRKFELTNYGSGLPAGTHTFTGFFVVGGVVTETTMTIDFV